MREINECTIAPLISPHAFSAYPKIDTGSPLVRKSAVQDQPQKTLGRYWTLGKSAKSAY